MFTYPYKEAVQARAKQSVTELKRLHEPVDEYSGNQLMQTKKTRITERPLFMQQDKQMTTAEVGTVMHTVMQHLPFKRALVTNEIEEFIATFIDREIITQSGPKSLISRLLLNFIKQILRKK